MNECITETSELNTRLSDPKLVQSWIYHTMITTRILTFIRDLKVFVCTAAGIAENSVISGHYTVPFAVASTSQDVHAFWSMAVNGFDALVRADLLSCRSPVVCLQNANSLPFSASYLQVLALASPGLLRTLERKTDSIRLLIMNC